MNWWHRAHSTPLAVTVLTATMLAVPLFGGSAVPIPSLLAGMSASIPVALVLPAVPAALILHALNRVPRVYDTTAVRPVASYQAGMLATTALIAVAIGLAATYVADSSMALAAARNFVGYLGIGLIVQQLLGHLYGPLAVTLVPVLCALIGLAPGGRPYPWTWPLHQAPSVIAATASLLLITSGIAAASFFTPRGAARRAST
ncbi:hypothetical protein AB0H24_31645 [Streptomyces globisporus]|uniref:hypothetical protein n=1 Tax=Streptomyces albovinaceus subgroup TaxID=1482558 RepID=UPI000A3A214B|nr:MULTISPECIES: hypothetical protein [Streptomyces]RDL04483.1 hypothetical protein DER30_6118 [Streptomyces sp. HB202]WSF80466.1 hypothetical protein OG838_32085 [Streptomyces globisporus]